MIADEGDGDGGIVEDLGSGLGEKAAEIFRIGFASGENGCTDEEGVCRGRERGVAGGLKEEEKKERGRGERV